RPHRRPRRGPQISFVDLRVTVASLRRQRARSRVARPSRLHRHPPQIDRSARAWYHAAMRRLLVTALVLAACDKPPASPPDRSQPVAARPAAAPGDHARPPAERAAHGAAGDPCSKAHPEGSMVMPWIADDLQSAL